MIGFTRVWGVFCIVLVLTVALLAAPASAGQEKVRWKAGTLAPKGVGWANLFENKSIPTISQATDGHVEIKVYWGGIMGDDEDYIKKMRIGQLHAAGLSGQGSTLAASEFAVVELPFMFRNFDEVDHLRRTMLDRFDGYLMENGFKILLWADQDFDQIYSIDSPMVTPRNFSKSRFVTWYGPLEEELLTDLGAHPIPLNVPEIPASLRQGIANALIGPAVWVVGTQTYSVLRYVNPVKIRYSPALILVTKAAFDELSPEYQQALTDVRMEMIDAFNTGVRQENDKCYKALVRYGLREADLTEAQLETMKKATRPVWEEMAGSLYSPELLQDVIANVEEFRASKQGAGQ